MKSFKSYLSIAAAELIAWGGFSGCQDDFDTPPLIVPEATIQANTTIADLKQKYWSDDNNYYMTIEKNEDGSEQVVAKKFKLWQSKHDIIYNVSERNPAYEIYFFTKDETS